MESLTLAPSHSLLRASLQRLRDCVASVSTVDSSWIADPSDLSRWGRSFVSPLDSSGLPPEIGDHDEHRPVQAFLCGAVMGRTLTGRAATST